MLCYSVFKINYSIHIPFRNYFYHNYLDPGLQRKLLSWKSQVRKLCLYTLKKKSKFAETSLSQPKSSKKKGCGYVSYFWFPLPLPIMEWGFFTGEMLITTGLLPWPAAETWPISFRMTTLFFSPLLLSCISSVWGNLSRFMKSKSETKHWATYREVSSGAVFEPKKPWSKMGQAFLCLPKT